MLIRVHFCISSNSILNRTARVGNPGLATTFYNERNDATASDLVKILIECKQEVPDFLRSYATGET